MNDQWWITFKILYVAGMALNFVFTLAASEGEEFMETMGFSKTKLGFILASFFLVFYPVYYFVRLLIYFFRLP